MKESVSLEGLNEKENSMCFSWIVTVQLSNQDDLSLDHPFSSEAQNLDRTIPYQWGSAV
jgi:hypothetical protein